MATESSRTTADAHDAEIGHGHAHREKPSYDDVNVPVIVLVGVISAVVTFMSIVFVQGLFYHWKNGVVQQVNYEVENPRQAEIIAKQKQLLDGDSEKGYASLESVISDVVAQYKSESNASPSTSGGQR